MSLIFPRVDLWHAAKPRGSCRSRTEAEAEERGHRRQPSTCFGMKEEEAVELGLHHLPARVIAERAKARELRLEEEAVELDRHHPHAASAPNYPGVSEDVVRDSSKAETRQQLALTN